MKRVDHKKYYMKTLSQFFAEANQDRDDCSGWWFGNGRKEAEGALFIVKGNEAANKAYNLLCNHGLITPGKPVVDKIDKT